MKVRHCLLALGLLTLSSHQAWASDDCEPFFDREWGCGSSATLGCVLIDVLSVPVSAVPRYDVLVGPGGVRQGLSWQLAIALDPRDDSCCRWEQDLALEGAWYPWGDPFRAEPDAAARATWRLWIPSQGSADWIPRLGFGLGSFVGLGGAGPRLEIRAWNGDTEGDLRTFGWFLAAAYEPDLVRNEHHAHFTTGLEMPLHL